MEGRAEERWMQEAFAEARLAVGTSRPNPAVGAILVRDGVVVGRGRTQKPGSHHAEIMALKDAGERAQGAEMYATLEPCCHWGRTPPCADAILAAKVGRVFVSCVDGNPKVNGGGVAKLRAGGIPVETGVLGVEGEDFYRGYHHHMRHGVPWVDVKIAQSLDGFIAGVHGERTQISSEQTNLWVHRLRASVDVIAIGGGTLRHDDPQLTVRAVVGNNPWRIVVCGDNPLPATSKLLVDGMAETLVYSRSSQPQLAGVVPVETWPAPSFADAWLALLQKLGSLGCHRVLFEAGATMAGLLLSDSRLWNRIFLLTAPKLLGQGLAWSGSLPPTWKDSLRLSRFDLVSCDFLTEFENVHWNHPSDRHHPYPRNAG